MEKTQTQNPKVSGMDHFLCFFFLFYFIYFFYQLSMRDLKNKIVFFLYWIMIESDWIRSGQIRSDQIGSDRIGTVDRMLLAARPALD